MKELIFSFCVISLAAASVSAQSRTVTNATLERYRDQRVQADRDLRENYARLGFPSPEERARRDEESARARDELADKLRAARLERERMQLERDIAAAELAAAQAAAFSQSMAYQDDWYGLGTSVITLDQLGGSGFGFGHGRHLRPRIRQQQGYFAGGQFWPVGPRTAPRPLIAPVRVRPPR